MRAEIKTCLHIPIEVIAHKTILRLVNHEPGIVRHTVSQWTFGIRTYVDTHRGQRFELLDSWCLPDAVSPYLLDVNTRRIADHIRKRTITIAGYNVIGSRSGIIDRARYPYILGHLMLHI